ncbi:redoxin domain-containing protein [Massilia endophytica]|uniref:redoxin domain-containing protein n=1 Tax=Massilia endophytica TaxID=2899220 RepID=UPI001E3F4798|nr:redoxin domain-containing protein [Massilia endophytica]UGQ46232.1 redoxin family protein [Massilia endophytica]
MKSIAALLLLAVLCAANAADDGGDGKSRAQSAGKRLIGQPGPSASLTTIDGKTIELAAFYGKKPVYLKFWATWCVPCREQMPGFEQIFQKYGSRIAVVAVNTGFSETEADVRSYRSRHGLHMPIVIDNGSLAGKLNLRVTPQHVLIGVDGRIMHVGHLADRELDEALEKAVSEKPAPLAILPAEPPVKSRAFKVGEEVSGITAETIAGPSVAFGPGGSGKPRALVFFSPWCETYLRESRPATAQACARVRKEAERLARRGDVEWLGVSAPLWASSGELAEYGKSRKTAIPLVLDRTGALFAAFGIRQIPSIVLIDATGRVAQVLGPEDRNIARAVQSLAPRQRLAFR